MRFFKSLGQFFIKFNDLEAVAKQLTSLLTRYYVKKSICHAMNFVINVLIGKNFENSKKYFRNFFKGSG